eukprot:5973605-Amphidinium_carterae.1
MMTRVAKKRKKTVVILKCVSRFGIIIPAPHSETCRKLTSTLCSVGKRPTRPMQILLQRTMPECAVKSQCIFFCS